MKKGNPRRKNKSVNWCIEKDEKKRDLQTDHSEIIKKCSLFFKVEDFASSEEVLNCGIELFPKSAQLYSNITAVRLKAITLGLCKTLKRLWT